MNDFLWEPDSEPPTSTAREPPDFEGENPPTPPALEINKYYPNELLVWVLSFSEVIESRTWQNDYIFWYILAVAYVFNARQGIWVWFSQNQIEGHMCKRKSHVCTLDRQMWSGIKYVQEEIPRVHVRSSDVKWHQICARGSLMCAR